VSVVFEHLRNASFLLAFGLCPDRSQRITASGHVTPFVHFDSFRGSALPAFSPPRFFLRDTDADNTDANQLIDDVEQGLQDANQLIDDVEQGLQNATTPISESLASVSSPDDLNFPRTHRNLTRNRFDSRIIFRRTPLFYSH